MWKVFNLKASPAQGGIIEKRILNIHTFISVVSINYTSQLH
jgi:hypothetical protein